MVAGLHLGRLASAKDDVCFTNLYTPENLHARGSFALVGRVHEHPLGLADRQVAAG